MITITEEQLAELAEQQAIEKVVFGEDFVSTAIEAMTDTSYLGDKLTDILKNEFLLSAIRASVMLDHPHRTDCAMDEIGQSLGTIITEAVRDYALEVAEARGYL